MSGSTALSGGAETGLTETAQGFTAERDALDLTKFFAQMVVVETSIRGMGQRSTAWRT
jgi:hypothetical protein